MRRIDRGEGGGQGIFRGGDILHRSPKEQKEPARQPLFIDSSCCLHNRTDFLALSAFLVKMWLLFHRLP